MRVSWGEKNVSAKARLDWLGRAMPGVSHGATLKAMLITLHISMAMLRIPDAYWFSGNHWVLVSRKWYAHSYSTESAHLLGWAELLSFKAVSNHDRVPDPHRKSLAASHDLKVT